MKPRLGKRMSCKVVVACSTKSLKKFSTYLFYRSSKKLLLMRFNWPLGSKKILVSFIGIIFWMCRFLHPQNRQDNHWTIVKCNNSIINILTDINIPAWSWTEKIKQYCKQRYHYFDTKASFLFYRKM